MCVVCYLFHTNQRTTVLLNRYVITYFWIIIMESDAGSDYSDCEYDTGKVVKRWDNIDVCEDKSTIVTVLYYIETLCISIHNEDNRIHSNEEFREILRNYLSDSCCLGNKALKEMKISVLDRMNSFECIREFYVEHKELRWVYEAYCHQKVHF